MTAALVTDSTFFYTQKLRTRSDWLVSFIGMLLAVFSSVAFELCCRARVIDHSPVCILTCSQPVSDDKIQAPFRHSQLQSCKTKLCQLTMQFLGSEARCVLEGARRCLSSNCQPRSHSSACGQDRCIRGHILCDDKHHKHCYWPSHLITLPPRGANCFARPRLYLITAG